MNNISTEGLPPEMQQRIAEIIDKAKTNAIQPQPQAQAQLQRPPSLMDHVVSLRSEVAALRQELANSAAQVQASSQVVEAVGGAVGQLYSMFFEQSQASTYSGAFQTQQPVDDSDY